MAASTSIAQVDGSGTVDNDPVPASGLPDTPEVIVNLAPAPMDNVLAVTDVTVNSEPAPVTVTVARGVLMFNAFKIPASTVVLPVYVQSTLRFIVPAPVFVNPPAAKA